MRLFEVAIASRAYSAFGGEFDDSLQALIAKAGCALDLESDECGAALLKWLNAWGCRQFSKDYHQDALRRLRDWAHQHIEELPSEDTKVLELVDSDIQHATRAYDALREVQASQRSRQDRRFSVRVGATGAAKILFALRPTSLPPWDDAIRARFDYDGSAASYGQFIRQVSAQLQELITDAAQYEITPEQLPLRIGRNASTLPKIVDEYYWVTITKGFRVPTATELKTWSDWCARRT
jgi:hypothetical protein